MKAISFLFILFCTVSTAQTSLTGYITIQNSKGQSAYPVQIKSFGATDAIANQMDGKFTLVYDKKKPGAPATLKIERTDYEVVNRRDLRVTLPKDNKVQRPVKLFLCPKGQWRKYADQYYKTNIQEINNNYKKQLQKVQEEYEAVTLENDAYREALFDLDEKKQAALSQAEEMAERFAKTNLDDATDRTATAHRLFTTGKLDSVLLVLNEKEILAAFQKAEQEIASGKELVQIGENKLMNGLEAKEKIVEEFMIKARAYIIKLQWDEAARSYEMATTADQFNFENVLEYNAFLIRQKKIPKAQESLGNSLQIVNEPLDKFSILYMLGGVYTELEDYTKAEQYFLDALRELKEIKDLSQIDLSYLFLSSVYSALGEMYSQQGAVKLAEENLVLALENSIKLTNKFPLEYNATFGKNLTNLGVLYAKTMEYTRSNEKLEKALSLVNGKSDPDKSLTGRIYLSLGFNNIQLKNYEKARLDLEKALTIFNKLSLNNPQAYNSFLANAYLASGNLYQATEDFRKAEEQYLKAEKILNKLNHESPLLYKKQLTHCMNDIGILYVKKKEYSKAENKFLELYEIRKEQVQNNPIVYQQLLANVECNIGALYYETKDYKKAISFLNSGITFFIKNDTELYWDSEERMEAFMPMLFDIGNTYYQKEDYSIANQAFTLYFKTYLTLSRENQIALKSNPGLVSKAIGVIHLLNSDFEQGEEHLLTALGNFYQLSIGNASLYETIIWTHIELLKDLYRENNELPMIEEGYAEIVKIGDKLIFYNPKYIYEVSILKIQYSLFCVDKYSKTENLKWVKLAKESLNSAKRNLNYIRGDDEKKVYLLNAIDGILNSL